MKLKVFFLFMFLTVFSWAQDRRPSLPYITGDGFRNFADFVIDETNLTFDFSTFKPRDLIFVKTDLLPYFFEHIHPLVPGKYVLITHNSDLKIPSIHANYLEDPKLIAWFGQNIEEVKHPKLHPLPIGLENRYCSNGNPTVMDLARKKKRKYQKSILLYVNFTPSTYPAERKEALKYFMSKPYCTLAEKKPYSSYLKDLSSSKFVISPRGNGLDCHRTWEALLLGAYPIVKTSYIDSLFSKLPVVIVKEWDEITEEFLNRKYEEFQKREWNLTKLFIPFWFQEIRLQG